MLIASLPGEETPMCTGRFAQLCRFLTGRHHTVFSVAKWFGSADREMRTNLLSNIESFADHLTPSLVNEKIFPNLALGFSDVSPKLRELTIRSIVVLAPKVPHSATL